MEGSLSELTRNPMMLVGLILFLIGFVVFGVAGFSSVNSAAAGPPDLSGVLCGWGIAAVGIGILVVSRWMIAPRAIPPPPPIQQPMVPAGTQGPVALNCPACGAPAQDIDRFGVATCPNCNTRFLVR